ncbi:MAG: hypothetical protein ACI8PZ_002586 [Myxococcota bacterium]|jgi:hypothetical protein
MLSGCRPLALAGALVLLGCRSVDCESGCAEARGATRACLDAAGLDWSARGWMDAADFDDWCQTWIWEAARLDGDRGHEACAVAAELADAPCDIVLAWPEGR